MCGQDDQVRQGRTQGREAFRTLRRVKHLRMHRVCLEEVVLRAIEQNTLAAYDAAGSALDKDVVQEAHLPAIQHPR